MWQVEHAHVPSHAASMSTLFSRATCGTEGTADDALLLSKVHTGVIYPGGLQKIVEDF